MPRGICVEFQNLSTNFTGIANVVSFAPMRGGERGVDTEESQTLCYLGKVSIEMIEPTIECALFDLEVLVFFFVIAWVVATGMKVSFAPGFDKSVCVDGDFGRVVAEKTSFGVSSLFEDGVDVRWREMLVDGTWCFVFFMITGMG